MPCEKGTSDGLVRLDKTAKLYRELNKKKVKRRNLWKKDWNK